VVITWVNIQFFFLISKISLKDYLLGWDYSSMAEHLPRFNPQHLKKKKGNVKWD
jgi:hypothetical protein